MHKSSLLEIIRTFTPKELIKFEDFVASPYFNKNKNVVNLFAEIKKYAPEFTNEKLEKEKIWKMIFPDKVYNYGIMKNLIFDLNKLGEQYIVSAKFAEDEPAHIKYLLKGFLDRYLHDHFSKTLVSATKKYDINYFDSNNYESSDYFRFRRALNKFEITYQQHFRQIDLTENFNINAAHLLSEFFIEIFKAYNDIIAESTTRNKDPNENIIIFFLRNIMEGKLEHMFDKFKDISVKGYNVLRIYYLMYESHTIKNDETRYYDFKDIVLNSKNDLSDSELRFIYSCLINSYVSNPPPGLMQDIELIEIFDSMIDKNIIKAPGEKWIEEHVFSYYIGHCANILNADKIRFFIKKYKDSINPEVLENMNIEINCLLSFIDKKYNDALKYLNELEFSNFGKKILSRSIKIRIFYEMNDYESFICERDAFNHFLSNNKHLINKPGMSENRSVSTKKGIDIINNLFLLRKDFTPEKYLEVKDLILKEHGHNYWLTVKMKEIEEVNGVKPKTKKLKIKS